MNDSSYSNGILKSLNQLKSLTLPKTYDGIKQIG